MPLGLSVADLPIDQLDLDSENPRIRKFIEQYSGTPSFDHMLLALGAHSSDPESGSTVTFQSLKESIRAQGGVINPIIVERQPSGRYKVVEGNTRVAIYMSFRNENVAGSWDSIPAIVHDTLPDFQADAIRLQCHIVGPRPWDPYSKAKYLDHLLNHDNLPLSTIVELCGGRRREIVDYVDAYRDMEKYYRPILESDGDFDPTRFSAFVELQKPNVKQAVLDASFSLTSFAEWIRDRKIDPLNTVRALPRILKNPPAKAKFLAVGAREAIKLLEVPPAPGLANASLDQLLRVVVEKLDTMGWRELDAIRADLGSERAQLLVEAHEVLSDVCGKLADKSD
ncbi:MAG: ParB/RepB/Spo0J family partition protein [Burkholderiales bacterium]